MDILIDSPINVLDFLNDTWWAPNFEIMYVYGMQVKLRWQIQMCGVGSSIPTIVNIDGTLVFPVIYPVFLLSSSMTCMVSFFITQISIETHLKLLEWSPIFDSNQNKFICLRYFGLCMTSASSAQQLTQYECQVVRMKWQRFIRHKHNIK